MSLPAKILGILQGVLNIIPGVQGGGFRMVSTSNVSNLETDGGKITFYANGNTRGSIDGLNALWSMDNAGTAGGFYSPSQSPAAITTSQNNYAPGQGVFQRWSATGAVNVTGMASGQPGETRFIWNVGANTITLTNQDVSSTAANRWLTTTAASLALAANKVALAQYDNTTAAWRVTLLP